MEEFDRMTTEIASLRTGTTELVAQLEIANAKIRAIQGREKTLLSTILDKSGSDKLLDGDLTRKFVNMRRQIQRLASNRLYASNGQLTRPYAPNAKDDLFYEDWLVESAKDRSLLLRAAMYHLLHRKILGTNHFGLFPGATAAGADQRHWSTIDRSLSRLEEALQDRRVPENDVTDWRVATFKCIQSAQLGNDEGANVAEDMYYFFERCMIEDAEDTEIGKLRQGFVQLCRDAMKMRLLMRSSPEGYSCVILCDGLPLSRHEDIAEPYAVLRGKSNEASDAIKFTLFGALVKHAKYKGEGEVVLEKAEVETKGPQRRRFSRTKGDRDEQYFVTLQPGVPLSSCPLWAGEEDTRELRTHYFTDSAEGEKFLSWLETGQAFRFAVEDDETIKWWWFSTKEDVMAPEGTAGSLLPSSGALIPVKLGKTVVFRTAERI
ncbi:hypothetical protein NLG97_g1112 [Lecanicillium saksenae]|uniref:Uncharacterized protein n=1 Tax=Lecanicillium saksenae TaxID=468837 RepID=A0ACC1R7B8_9HYPO|nr:hypothetical protein NLG97_g1112 [Lecanicillium saksenae]